MVRCFGIAWQQWLLGFGLAAWIGLGAAHVAIVMTGPNGWSPDRSAAGADAVVGHPHDNDPRAVAGALELASSATPTRPGLLLVLGEATDSADLLYTRFQLAHLLYPRRVEVRRAVGMAAAPPDDAASTLFVVAPGVAAPPGCSATAEALGHRLLACARP